MSARLAKAKRKTKQYENAVSSDSDGDQLPPQPGAQDEAKQADRKLNSSQKIRGQIKLSQSKSVANRNELTSDSDIDAEGDFETPATRQRLKENIKDKDKIKKPSKVTKQLKPKIPADAAQRMHESSGDTSDASDGGIGGKAPVNDPNNSRQGSKGRRNEANMGVAKAGQSHTSESKPVRLGKPNTSTLKDDGSNNSYAIFKCPNCALELPTSTDLLIHQRRAHGMIGDSDIRHDIISETAKEFLKSWTPHPDLVLQIAVGSEILGSPVVEKHPPRLLCFDDGLSLSFQIVPVIPTHIVQEVIARTFFTQVFGIDQPFEVGDVNRIIVNTSYGRHAFPDRGVEVNLAPPIVSDTRFLNEILSLMNDDLTFNPVFFRCNVIFMALKFVLANLYINAATAFMADQTFPTEGKLLRTIEDHNNWWPVMYPTRTVTVRVNKLSHFVEQMIIDRTGRVGRSQDFRHALNTWVDVLETADSLTTTIRDMYTQWMMRMNIQPQEVSIALTECAQSLVAFTVSFAPTPLRLMPWRATTEDRRLAQMLDIAYISTDPQKAEQIVLALANSLRAITILELKPAILSEALSRVTENTQQNVSPAAALLRLLRPSSSDMYGFWAAIASWLYNGMVTTILQIDNYPAPNTDITNFESLWKALIVTLAMPITNDPNGPCKVFMTFANLLSMTEQIDMGGTNMRQNTPAHAFNLPGQWPAALLNRNALNRRTTPILYDVATFIRDTWPNPGQIRYGSPDILGTTELFTPPGVLQLPGEVLPINLGIPIIDFENGWFRWVRGACRLVSRMIMNINWQVRANEPTRQAVSSTLSLIEKVGSFSYTYLANFLPHELAALAPALAMPPLQVPYVRLNRDQIPVELGIRLHDVVNQIEPSRWDSSTHVNFGTAMYVDANAIVVALLGGTISEKIQPNVHYAERLVPLYTPDDFFAPYQRAVIMAEAFNTMRMCLAQVAETNYVTNNPLEFVRQMPLSAQPAAKFAERINEIIKQAFDLKGHLLEGLIEQGDPRFSSLLVGYRTFGDQVVTETANARDSMISRGLQLTEEVIRATPNWFNIATGDVIISLQHTAAGWSGLNPPPGLIFDVNDPDVRVCNDRLQYVSGLNGQPAQLLDNQGRAWEMTGRWVMSIDTLRANVAVVITHILPRLRKGDMHLRIRMTAVFADRGIQEGTYPYVITYYDPVSQVDEYEMVKSWLEGMSPTSVPAVPFSAPRPASNNITTQMNFRYMIATSSNEQSLIGTNLDAPRTWFGQDQWINVQNWRTLCDPDADIRENQLPDIVDLYTFHRRYNFVVQPPTKIVSMNANPSLS